MASASADPGLERASRALRLAVDVACLGLLFGAWFLAAEVPVAHLVTLWIASYLAIPRPPVAEQIRQHTLASAVISLLGIWLIGDTLLRDTTRAVGGVALYPMRNVFQGLLFTLAGASNLLAARAHPQKRTSVSSLCCGAAAVAAGITWVVLAMQGGGIP
jgi:hypothetical protein